MAIVEGVLAINTSVLLNIQEVWVLTEVKMTRN